MRLGLGLGNDGEGLARQSTGAVREATGVDQRIDVRQMAMLVMVVAMSVVRVAGMVQMDVERCSGEPPSAHLLHGKPVAVERHRRESRAHCGFVAAQVQQRTHGHVAGDAACPFKVECLSHAEDYIKNCDGR